MAKNEIVLKILGDSSGATKALQDVTVKSEGFGSKMGTIFGAIGGVAMAKGIFDFAEHSVDAFKESEDSAHRLQDAFEKFPALADVNINAFEKLNTELAKKTRFDDDATASGQAVLAQFNLTGQQIQQLTPLLQDYAAKTGQDIPAAAEALGKAMLGKGRALADIGIKFKDTGSAAGNFDEVIAGLRTQVGGFAEKEGKTAAGRAEILHNQFGELQETVGSKLVPVLLTLSNGLLDIIGWFQDLNPGVQTAIGVAIGLVGAVFAVVEAVKAWTAIQAALDVVLNANPIGVVILAIAALIAAVIYAYNHFTWFRDGVQAVFGFVAGAAQWLGAVFSNVWDGIVTGFAWVRDTLKSIANWIITNVINRVIDGVNAFSKFYNLVPGHADVPHLDHVPMLAAGAVLTKPTLFMGGEGGEPEAVVPLSKAGSLGFGGGPSVSLTVQGNVIGADERALEDLFTRMLERFFARGGALSNGRGGTLAPA